MQGFQRTRAGYVGGLTAAERLVLAQVASDVVELLDDDSGLGAGEHDGADDAIDGGYEGYDFPEAEAPDPRWWSQGLDLGLVPIINAEVPPVPTDAAVRRLLPEASTEDPELAQEFRRLTEADLRVVKSARLLSLASSLVEEPPGEDTEEHLRFLVSREAARDIAAAFTDIRLVLGERLHVRSDADSQRLYDAIAGEQGAAAGSGRDGDPDAAHRAFLGSVFVMVGVLQESLMECLLADLPR